jgi:hypothetical protein
MLFRGNMPAKSINYYQAEKRKKIKEKIAH